MAEYTFLLYHDNGKNHSPIKVCQDIEAAEHFLRQSKDVRNIQSTKIQMFEDDKEVSLVYKIKVTFLNYIQEDYRHYILSREEIYNAK